MYAIRPKDLVSLIKEETVKELQKLKLIGTSAGDFSSGGDGEDIVIVEGFQIDDRIAQLQAELKEDK